MQETVRWSDDPAEINPRSECLAGSDDPGQDSLAWSWLSWPLYSQLLPSLPDPEYPLTLIRGILLSPTQDVCPSKSPSTWGLPRYWGPDDYLLSKAYLDSLHIRPLRPALSKQPLNNRLPARHSTQPTYLFLGMRRGLFSYFKSFISLWLSKHQQLSGFSVLGTVLSAFTYSDQCQVILSSLFCRWRNWGPEKI